MTSSMRSLEVTTLSNTHAKDHGKTTLDDGSVRRRDLYLKRRNIHKRHTLLHQQRDSNPQFQQARNPRPILRPPD
jgi:hypothetical protein